MSADQVAAFRPAPVTQRDGSSLANANCRMASIATGIAYETRNATTSTGSKMRSYSGDTSGGTSSSDAVHAWSSGYSRSLSVRDGSTFDQALADLRAGRLVHLDVWHAGVGSAPGICLSGSGAYGHTIAVLPDCLDGSWLVADPWCSPGKWGRVPESQLRRGAEQWGGEAYGRAAEEPDWPTGGAPDPRDPIVLAIVRRIVDELLELWQPGDERGGRLRFEPETGGGQPILYTITAAQSPEVDMDIEVASSTPMLVDLPPGADVLELDGSKRLENTTQRNGVLSPFATHTAGGTGSRAIYWTRGSDPTLLLSAYTNQCQNVRPVESGGGGGSSDVDAALADRDAEWIDSLTEAWPAKPA
jgi:hypothetical protein